MISFRIPVDILGGSLWRGIFAGSHSHFAVIRENDIYHEDNIVTNHKLQRM